MKNKITILTGAGFTVSPDFGGPSTNVLTNKLRKLRIENFDINGKAPGEYFYQKLCKHYTGSITNECDLSIINFETIVHLVEEIYAHLTSYNKHRESIGDKLDTKKLDKIKRLSKVKGVTPSFLVLNSSIKKDLNNLNERTKSNGIYKVIKKIYSYFIDAIINEVKTLNSNANNVGMRCFEKEFLNKFLTKAKFTRRFYSTNYDTWLNKYLGIYDGFDSNGNFEVDKVLSRFDIDCHFNLHGSILWQNDLEENNMKKLKNPVNYLNHSLSSQYGINREPLIATPIITGYHKLERMKFTPYLQFYYALQNDILNSKLLLIIGYSFSDTHINNILSLFKGKCVVVDYVSNFHNIGKIKSSLKDAPIIQSVTPDNGGFKSVTDATIKDGWIKSQNGKTRFWGKGIGVDFYKNWESIIS